MSDVMSFQSVDLFEKENVWGWVCYDILKTLIWETALGYPQFHICLRPKGAPPPKMTSLAELRGTSSDYVAHEACYGQLWLYLDQLYGSRGKLPIPTPTEIRGSMFLIKHLALLFKRLSVLWYSKNVDLRNHNLR